MIAIAAVLRLNCDAVEVGAAAAVAAVVGDQQPCIADGAPQRGGKVGPPGGVLRRELAGAIGHAVTIDVERRRLRL